MAKKDLSIKIAGAAGQGLETITALLAKAFSRHGLHVYVSKVVESRVRGGHNWFQVRVSDRPVNAPLGRTDILVALDRESSAHFKELKKDSIVLCEAAHGAVEAKGFKVLAIPYEKIAQENGGNRLMSNTVAVGAVLGILAYEIEVLLDLIRESFKGKAEDMITANLKVARGGYDFARQQIRENVFARFGEKASPPKMLASGSEAIALGAIAAGCKFISAYPMSPSTGIMTYMASKADLLNLVVEQSEDEIASINMALGASFAGVRAMTATSGGGFALMQEGVSLAGMTETPLVVVDAQRPAPATGLPTRTAQEDLLFVVFSGHGEFPKAVLAPATIEEAFHMMPRAFNLAEKFQIPVIVLSDQLLSEGLSTFEEPDCSKIKIERHLLETSDLKEIKDYKRYRLTKTGVSPRALPGNPYALVMADSDEHDEAGRITEDLEFMRPAMVEKRNKKDALLLKEMRRPRWVGPKDAKNFLITWGSTYGAAAEALDLLRGQKEKVALVHFSDLWPLRADYFKFLDKAKFAAVVENNFSGQFRRLIAHATGRALEEGINKYNGLAFEAEEIVTAYWKLKKKKGPSRKG